MEQSLKIMRACVVEAGQWFVKVMFATRSTQVYIAGVFISLTVGFLLSNFGNAYHTGLNAASDLAGNAYKKRNKKLG